MSTDQIARYSQAEIVADKEAPQIHIYRDFKGTPAQLFRAHTDPELFTRWVGPASIDTEVVEWDARDGGSWRYIASRGTDFRTSFRGCFHTVSPEKLVQTFSWEGEADQVALETMTFEDLGDGYTRLHAISLCGSFTVRDQWLAGGMATGVNEGYAALDQLLADGAL